MAERSTVRALVATAAGVAIALSITSVRRQWEEADMARAARAVIQQQLAAFRKNDYAAAYRHAAPEIQEQFAVAEFRRMVREGYPQIAHSREASFGDARFRGEVVAVSVTVTGEDGVAAKVLYLMRRVAGQWRVAGVEGSASPGGSPDPPSAAPRPKKRPDAV